MRAFLLLMVLALPLLAAPVPKEFRGKKLEYCPLAVGDKREYVHPSNPDIVTQVREITAMEIKGGVKHFTQLIPSSDQTNIMKVEKDGVYMVEQNGELYDPPYAVVRNDMKEGDRWECKDSTGMIRTVGKGQKIDTPAGSFTAIPVTVSYGEQPGPGDIIVWYADGVGLVRLDSGGRTSLVLKKYTPGKAAK